MQQTFLFYDLETSGINPRTDRIMQFAGQRTDLNFKPIGQPINLLVKLPDDTLPSPHAIMVTKITPQMTQADGITEADLAHFLMDEVFTPNTISLGYNNIRFDDEFIRHLFWRTFHDPYAWQWQDNRSRWDLLDVVRMTRALRPAGINWPTLENGKITNKLDLLTVANHIEHANAHDALADVNATIAIAKLIKTKQPELFDYLFTHRDKKSVQSLVNLAHKKPFVYSSGRYGTKHNFTTVAFPLTTGRNGNVLVYDLRYNLLDLQQKEQDAVFEEGPESRRGLARDTRDDGLSRRASEKTRSCSFYPYVKELQYNRCPAVAPVGVLSKDDSWSKIDLEQGTVKKNLHDLLAHPEFAEQMRSLHEQQPDWPAAPDVESALYESFIPDPDRVRCDAIQQADAERLADLHPNFIDERLPDLLLHYKARNFKNSLSEDEVEQWETYRHKRLQSQAPHFFKALEELSGHADDFLLEELSLWCQSLMPSDY